MRILLDECLPKDFRKNLEPHQCTSVVDFGYLPGRQKENLLAFAEGIFDVFLTLRRSDAEDPKLRSPRIAVITLSVQSNRMNDLGRVAGKVLAILDDIQPGQIVHVKSQGTAPRKPHADKNKRQ